MRRAIYEDDVIKLLDKGWKSGVYPVASNIHALPSAQPEQEWIPITDHLPDEDVPVLVTDDAGGMATIGVDSCGRYEDTGERFWYTSQNVTAWMPGPACYQSKEK